MRAPATLDLEGEIKVEECLCSVALQTSESMFYEDQRDQRALAQQARELLFQKFKLTAQPIIVSRRCLHVDVRRGSSVVNRARRRLIIAS